MQDVYANGCTVNGTVQWATPVLVLARERREWYPSQDPHMGIPSPTPYSSGQEHYRGIPTTPPPLSLSPDTTRYGQEYPTSSTPLIVTQEDFLLPNIFPPSSKISVETFGKSSGLLLSQCGIPA